MEIFKMDAETWHKISEAIEDEDSVILKVVNRHKSDILLAGADVSHQDWRDNVQDELRDLMQSFETHSRSSEQSSGLIGMVQSINGHSRLVNTVVGIHCNVLESAELIQQGLEDEKATGFSVS